MRQTAPLRSHPARENHVVPMAPVSSRPQPPVAVRRRGSREQGRALEMLGHAVEYLVDSRLFRRADDDLRADEEAVQILMRLSRVVFAECPEVVSLRRQIGRWILERFSHHPGGHEAPGR